MVNGPRGRRGGRRQEALSLPLYFIKKRRERFAIALIGPPPSPDPPGYASALEAKLEDPFIHILNLELREGETMQTMGGRGEGGILFNL